MISFICLGLVRRDSEYFHNIIIRQNSKTCWNLSFIDDFKWNPDIFYDVACRAARDRGVSFIEKF